jgi:hypothetical protein
VRIRNYVLELKQAKKNGQGQTSADGNGSLGSQSSNGNNGSGKYDIEQITHTLQKEGKVYVPPQFLHEIVRELRRRGFLCETIGQLLGLLNLRVEMMNSHFRREPCGTLTLKDCFITPCA